MPNTDGPFRPDAAFLHMDRAQPFHSSGMGRAAGRKGVRRRPLVCRASASVSADRCQPGSALMDGHLVDGKLRRTDVVDAPTLGKGGPQIVRTGAAWSWPGVVLAVPEHEVRAARLEDVRQTDSKARALLG